MNTEIEKGEPAPLSGEYRRKEEMSERVVMKKVIAYLPAPTYKKLMKMQKETGIPRSEIIRTMISKFFCCE